MASAAQTFRRRLIELHAVVIELSAQDSFDNLCRRAIELGRARLGFERLGLWFMADEPQVAVGSFGTDEQGRLRDERHSRVTAAPGSKLGQIWGAAARVIVEHDSPIRDHTGATVATGSTAFAALWDGEQVIGSLNCDNLLSGRLLTEDDADLLSLYAASLGRLCTEQRAKERLRRSEALYRAVVETQSDLIVRLDPERRIVFVNEAVCRLLGREPADLLGEPSFEFLSSEGDRATVDAALRGLFPAQPTTTVELAMTAADGRVHWVEWGIRALYDAAGRLAIVQSVGRDVTERRQMQQELRRRRDELRALAAKLHATEEEERRRIAFALHDGLGQNLTACSTRLAVARRTLGGRPEAVALDRVTEILEQTTEDLSSLMVELYPPVLHDAGFLAAVEWLAEQTTRSYGLAVEVIDEGLAGVEVASEIRPSLFAVTRELLHNVAKHARAQRAVVRTRIGTEAVTVVVEDDGVGFDVDQARAQRAGHAGIGLLSVRERLAYHGGSLHIDSQPQRGTRVTLRVDQQAATGLDAGDQP